MAKKRRVRSTPSTAPRAAPTPAREASPSIPTTSLPPRRPASSLASYDYTYVRRDLRRIGILAAILLGAQVALVFILPQFLR